MFVFTSRFQKWFLPFFLLTFKVKVKGHGFRIYGTTYYVTVFGIFAVKRGPKPSYIESRYLITILLQLSNDLDLPTRKVKVI